MANMWDLTGTDLAKNYRRVSPSTQFGTRKLRVIEVVFGTGGTSDVDLTAQKWTEASTSFTGSYTDSDSYFSKAVLSLQNYAEVWAVGKPSATAFLAIISDDTAQDSANDTNVIAVPGVWQQAEENLAAAMGYGNYTGGVTKYNGAVAITDKFMSGNSLSSVRADTGTTTGDPADQLGSNDKT